MNLFTYMESLKVDGGLKTRDTPLKLGDVFGVLVEVRIHYCIKHRSPSGEIGKRDKTPETNRKGKGRGKKGKREGKRREKIYYRKTNVCVSMW